MPVGTQIYDNTEYVLNVVRSLGNDAIQSLAGNLLNDNKPYVPVYLNSGYRYLQTKLASCGYQTFKKTVWVPNVLVVTPLDPGVTVSLSYSGFFDGTQQHASPMLPSDLCWPIKLWERQHGTTQVPRLMYQSTDGIYPRAQGIWLRDWVWQNDQIIMNGATQINDIQLTYVNFLPELTVGNTPSQVLIPRCSNALAAYTLWQFAFARGSPLADTALTMGDTFVRQMLAQDSMLKQRKNYRRQPFSRNVHSGWYWM